MLEWTGERYMPFIDPSICGAEIHYEHLHRYAFAAQYVHKKKVLDLASGEGFGSSLLAKNAQCVIGVDINHNAILHASRTYTQKNISFIKGSMLSIPIGGKKIFDVIVCFEALEHVSDHEILFQEISRLLKDDGILIISTPNKKTYTDETGYQNPFHQKELYFSEFCNLLKIKFHFIYLSGQRIVTGSSIYPLLPQKSIDTFSEFDIEHTGERFSFSENAEKIPAYFIAIASNSHLEPDKIQASYLIDLSNTETSRLNALVTEGNSTIHSLNQTLVGKDQEIREMRSHIESLNQEIVDRDREVSEQTARIQMFEQKVAFIEGSIIWQFTMKFHIKIVERLLPQQTARRKYYDLCLKGFRILLSEGPSSLWWQFKEFRAVQKMTSRGKKCISETVISFPFKEHTKSIDKTVSVIIPTKNAGHDFDNALNKIRSQRGIKKIEIVVVDSGSTDNTLEIAKKYQATIIQIKPEEFDHGKTRNLGAAKSHGDYLLFTTQDAILAGNWHIYRMLNFFDNDSKIAAVTCTQVPRSDADLMACYQVWAHYCKFLNINSDKIVSANSLHIPPQEKRRLANLSDSCCCLKRELFLQYQYAVDFAEDLELGLRLLNDGYKLGFLSSAAIIHSHNRNAAYFFKANYADSKLVSQILENPPLPWNTGGVRNFFAAIRLVYSKLCENLGEIQNDANKDPMIIIETLKYQMQKKEQNTRNNVCTDITLDNLFSDLDQLLQNAGDVNPDTEIYRILLLNYIHTLDAFSEYCKNYKTIQSINEDFVTTLFKLFASSSASSLGNFVLYLETTEKNDNVSNALDLFLRKGV